jgi:predicted metal-dependent phosphotriesterase family hydrolase
MSEMKTQVPVERLTKAYLKIKQKRAELSADYKEQDDELVAQLDKIKRALLNYCKEQGVESVRTSEGMFYRTTKQRYWTNDWESMYKFVLEHQVPEFFDKRLNQTNVKQFLEENPELAPTGLQVDSEYIISVRKK